MTAFFGIVIGIGFIFTQIYQNPSILYVAVIFSVLMSITSYWFSDKIVLALHRAKPVNMQSNPELYRILENLTIAAGLPMPKFYIINDPAPNAFSTGRNPKHAVVCITTGIMERLDRSEMEGVLAHELMHIGNRDMLVSTVAVVLVGFISIVSDIFLRSMWFASASRRSDEREGGGALVLIGIILSVLAPIIAMLLQLAISRRREFLADSSGALLTRYPEGLISALKKISADPRPLSTATNATAHLFFENPFKADSHVPRKTAWIVKLFMTHPPVEDRIKALEGR
ncbi:MAG: M48 family metallopeptidase [Candidatus Sungbacteria bacterium]|uniref:Protease HtpX homolog n=1 Tax=Candidatus Sungiibacteriota bacterium TaxID=2750080 RepID=A0A9D6LS94_9BACT|nr:M48 family metallopeptidase [Candidatus Sungbacteria bacterium]